MQAVRVEEVRGPARQAGEWTVVPIARTWSVGIQGPGWWSGASYAAPALEVAHADGRVERVAVPDVGLLIRVAALLAVAAAVFTLGGRR